MKHRLFSWLLALPLALSVAPAGAGASLPRLERARTAVLITDPQNEFLREDGKLHGLLKENLAQLDTVANIEKLMRAAKGADVLLAVDPLAYGPLDREWTHAGALQRQLLDMGALVRSGGQGDGGDFYEPFKRYIFDGRSLVVAPHKLYGPESNDLIYQLRARGIDTVVLGGLVANLCVDSHMRALMENGFRVYVVKDAVAAPGEAAYQAALVNFGMIANGVWTTAEALRALNP